MAGRPPPLGGYSTVPAKAGAKYPTLPLAQVLKSRRAVPYSSEDSSSEDECPPAKVSLLCRTCGWPIQSRFETMEEYMNYLVAHHRNAGKSAHSPHICD